MPLILRLVPEAETLTPPQAVEGSNGLLIEVDGQIVPNYDATIVHFNEGDVVSGNVVRIDKDEVLERLPDRPAEAETFEPFGWSSTRRRLALADLVAVDDEHPRAGASELARDGESGKARSAHEHVAVGIERGAIGATLRLARWHEDRE